MRRNLLKLQMQKVKEINIKSQTYYFFNNIFDIKHFHPKLLKINKKLFKDFNIYHFCYMTIKKFADCENIHSINPSYLIIGHLKKITRNT